MTASTHRTEDAPGGEGRGRTELEVLGRRVEGDRLEAELRAPPDLVYFSGHFPNDPLLPGVVQLNDVALAEVERAWPDLGRLERVQRLKFIRAIRPGDPFTLRLERRGRPGQVALTILAADAEVCTSAVLSFADDRGGGLEATPPRPSPATGEGDPDQHGHAEHAPSPVAGEAGWGCAQTAAAITGRDHAFRPCAVIPTVDDAATLAAVVEGVRAHLDEVIVVDDGSGPAALEVARGLERAGRARVVRRARNGGKGAAVIDGLRLARALGFTHALQVDADGQHDLRDVPRFLAAARAHPRAFVTGRPVFDGSAPPSRRAARLISVFWVSLETAGREIRDPLCGFRVYPLEATLAANPRARRMGHDPEVAVRLCWAGAPVINLDTRIRYPAGGASRYDLVHDNLEMIRTHTRLCLEAVPRLLWRGLTPWIPLSGFRGEGEPPIESAGSPLPAKDGEGSGERAAKEGPGVRRTPVTRRLGWLDVAERGTAAGLGFLAVLSTVAGRAPARAFLRLVVPYYVAAHGPARRASRGYLARIGGGGRVPLPRVHDHLLRFAQCTLDRLFFVRGKVELFEVHSHGEEHLTALLDRGQGALLLGAHLGSFEAMQRMADARRIPINVVGFFRNARLLAAVLERLNPGANARLLEIEPGGVDFVLRIRERIERGELVALLADRTWPGGRSAPVEFLGGAARLPTGPFRLAAALGCPVLLAFGLHTPPRRYDLHCEPFADRVVLPRSGREAALQQLAQRFAGRLEHYCRLAPDNWFNFYDFWDDTAAGEGAAP